MSEGRAATRQTRETGCGDVQCFFSIPFFLGVEIGMGRYFLEEITIANHYWKLLCNQ
jgi:hypothetical protein